MLYQPCKTLFIPVHLRYTNEDIFDYSILLFTFFWSICIQGQESFLFLCDVGGGGGWVMCS